MELIKINKDYFLLVQKMSLKFENQSTILNQKCSNEKAHKLPIAFQKKNKIQFQYLLRMMLFGFLWKEKTKFALRYALKKQHSCIEKLKNVLE